jgi:hypothetical protein
MIKNKIFILSIIIFPLLLGFLATTPADAVEDFSGDWSGQWNSITSGRSGGFYLHLNQSGASVYGTMTVTGGTCSPIENWPLTGNITNNVFSFNASGTCGGNNGLMEASQGVLTNNNLSGLYTWYTNGSFYGQGTFNVKRAVNYINSTAGTGGTIIPAGKISVNAGSDKTFKIVPNNGYKILDVKVDGVSVGAKTSYTFSKISANHTITATFETASTATGSIVPTSVAPLLLDDE